MKEVFMNSRKIIKIIVFLLILSQLIGCASKNTILESQKALTNVKKEKVSTNYVKSPDGKHAISASDNKYHVLLYKNINKSEPKSIKIVGLDYKFLWSPASNKVCISYRGRIWGGFSIIDVDTESVLEKPTIDSIVKQLKANGSKINYELNENRADPYLTPIEWSQDNKNILIFYQWVDKEFKVQNGVFIFDSEAKRASRMIQYPPTEGHTVDVKIPDNFKW
jgi:hypothetical protein